MWLKSSRSNATSPRSRSESLRGVHLGAHERMAADRALAEDDQVAREDVRALDRDRDRHRLVVARQVVLGPQHDRLCRRARPSRRSRSAGRARCCGTSGSPTAPPASRRSRSRCTVTRDARASSCRRCRPCARAPRRRRGTCRSAGRTGGAAARTRPTRRRRPSRPPSALLGSTMLRPTASCCTSMRQPWPAIFAPPMIASSGTNTSRPRVGPFWNGMLIGK